MKKAPLPAFVCLVSLIDLAGATLDLRVLTADGREVRSWMETQQHGVASIIWDGLDLHGRRVASGRHYLEVQEGKGRRTCVVVVLVMWESGKMSHVFRRPLCTVGLIAGTMLAGCGDDEPHKVIEHPSIVVRGTVLDATSQSILVGVQVWHDTLLVGETDTLGRYDVFDGMIPRGWMIYRKNDYRTDSLRLPGDFEQSPTESYVYRRDVLLVRVKQRGAKVRSRGSPRE